MAAAGVPVAVASGALVGSAVTVSVGAGVGVSVPWAVSLAGAIACQPSTSARSAAHRTVLKAVCRCLNLIVPWSAKKSGDIIPELGSRVNVAICRQPR